MRVLDDKIIHSLNSCLPTDSFRGKVNGETACKQLHGEVRSFCRLLKWITSILTIFGGKFSDFSYLPTTVKGKKR